MQWQGGPLIGGLPSTDITVAKTEEPRTDEYPKGSHFSVSQHLPVVLRISDLVTCPLYHVIISRNPSIFYWTASYVSLVPSHLSYIMNQQ